MQRVQVCCRGGKERMTTPLCFFIRVLAEGEYTI